MLTILTVTTPIYLLIALGYLAVRLRWLEVADIRSLGRYVARFALPALLYRAVAAQPIGAVMNARYLAVYAAGSLASMLAIRTFARLRGRAIPLSSMQGLGCACSNSAFIGYPIVLPVVGPAAGTALALNTLVENLFMIPLGLSLAESREGTRAWRSSMPDAVAGLARNPMFVGILLGVIASAVQLHLPPPADRAIGLLAAAASPTSLFVIGGSLVGLRLGGIRSDLATMAVGKLALHPLCVAAFVFLLPPAEPALRAAAILFAAAPMLSILPILAQRHGEEAFCAAALLTVIVSSFFTIAVAIPLMPDEWVLPAWGEHAAH